MRVLSFPLQFVKALCLDLDGTVRRSKGGHTFIKDETDIELMPGIEKIINRYRSFGWLIFAISNQGGVAHGFKTHIDVQNELDATIILFEANPFHIIKQCYHEPSGKVEPFNHRSLLRKPDIGMLALAEKDAYDFGYIVDWDHSIMVGDRPEDEELAKNAGIQFFHIETFLTMPHVFTL